MGEKGGEGSEAAGRAGLELTTTLASRQVNLLNSSVNYSVALRF